MTKNNAKIWLTSDTHFGHTNIIGYTRRPFFKDGLTSDDVDSIIEEEARKTGVTIDDRGRERVRVRWKDYVDIKAHDDTLIQNWNNVVGKNDTVFHLGDFAFPDARHYLKRLNGRVILIRGNHDKQRNYRDLFAEYHPAGLFDLKLYGENFVLCHYPMLSWNKSFHGSIHFYGHVHSKPDKPYRCTRNSYDVGVDNNNYTPILLEDAVIKARNNKNIITL